MNRPQLQELSDQRLAEAKLLRDHGFWSGAYYLAGYSIELAIKSCILKRIEMTGIIFIDKNFQMNCWTHDLPKLVKTAELERDLGLTQQSDLAFKMNWDIIKDWDEATRYHQIGELNTRSLIKAIEDPHSGVLQWLKIRW